MDRLPFRKSHALLIGVSSYDHFEDLQTPLLDIQAIADVLTTDLHDYTVNVLQDPTQAELMDFLEQQRNEIGSEDRLLLYFAGHGIAIDADHQGAAGYLLPRDADRQSFEGAIPMRDIRAFIDSLPCRHGLVVLDCCFAGAFQWDLATRKLDLMPKRIYQQRFDRFIRDPAWQIITSASYDQRAIDYLGDNSVGDRNQADIIFQSENSPFAAAFIKGLEGAADIIPAQPDGLITATELYLYLRETLEPVTIDLGENYRQTPRLFALPQHDKGEYLFLSPSQILQLPDRPNRNPYKGLAAFEEEDRDLFFGRERVIQDLLRHLEDAPLGLAVVTGASGTGKSSLVKAGLLPKLRDAGYEILPVIRPGRTPARHLHGVLEKAAAGGDEIKLKRVLVVDQSEELITQCESEQERFEFEALLWRFVQGEGALHNHLILTVRSDFEPQLQVGTLAPSWQQARFVIPPFQASELKAIILQPANQAVVEFDPPSLVDNIINEVIQAPGALPLLSFLLYELYETSMAGPDRPMKLADYNRLGGVVGALRTRADELFLSCSPEEQTTMKKLMIRLVAQDGGEIAGLRVLRSELVYPEDEENQRVERIIARFLKAALLVSGGENNERYIEPAHDALVRAWGSLWQWIKAFGEDTIAVKNILRRDLLDYQLHQQDKTRLWVDNPRLDQLVEISQQSNHWLTRDEFEFVKTSERLRRRKRNRLISTITSVATVIVGLGIASIFFGIRSNANAELARQRGEEAAESAADALNRLAERERLEMDELIRHGTIFLESGDDSLALSRFLYVRDTFLSKEAHLEEDSLIHLVEVYIDSCQQNLLSPNKPL